MINVRVKKVQRLPTQQGFFLQHKTDEEKPTTPTREIWFGSCYAQRCAMRGYGISMVILKYGPTELDYLKKRDKQLWDAIDRIGMIEREVMPDIFAALVYNVASQQISAKAVETVWARMVDRFGEITSESVSGATQDEIRQCGMSMRKAGYIRGIGAAVADGSLDLAGLSRLPDDKVIERLTALPGIGTWTAEMILIFSMCRPDVVSEKDLAIRRGMMMLYGIDTLSREAFFRYRKRYSPYGTVASLYLWEISHRKDW